MLSIWKSYIVSFSSYSIHKLRCQHAHFAAAACLHAAMQAGGVGKNWRRNWFIMLKNTSYLAFVVLIETHTVHNNKVDNLGNQCNLVNTELHKNMWVVWNYANIPIVPKSCTKYTTPQSVCGLSMLTLSFLCLTGHSRDAKREMDMVDWHVYNTFCCDTWLEYSYNFTFYEDYKTKSRYSTLKRET